MHPAPEHEVIIIGNGPAGLALSAFLSGITPFYSSHTSHPDALLHQRMLEAGNDSLLDQDLSWTYAADEFGGALKPISALYDSLARPAADTGADAPSCLRFRQDPARKVEHLVLGATKIGGSWTKYDKEMIAVSVQNWLDLPGFSIAEWWNASKCKVLPARISARDYIEYMEAYARHFRLTKHIVTNTVVKSITKEGAFWRVRYIESVSALKQRLFQRTVSTTARRVVLACGKSRHRQLQFTDPERHARVAHDVKTLRKLLRCAPGEAQRVVVVGDGISSADLVNCCLERRVPVLHVMKRSEKALRATIMARLSPSTYPEYSRVYKLMLGRELNSSYDKLTEASVIDASADGLRVLAKGEETFIPYTVLGVCIGRESDGMSLLPDKYTFNDYVSDEDATLMAVGSFAGDHFVRYLVGGCLDVARTIYTATRSAELSPSLCSSSSSSSDSLPSV